MAVERICSRPGCRKALRSDNTKGKCSKNCQSPEAPANQRAKGVEAGPNPPAAWAERTPEQVAKFGPSSPPPARAEVEPKDALVRFNTVATALGKDPGEILAEFAEAWLAELRQRVA